MTGGEVTDEAREARQAGNARLFKPEGGLSAASGGRSSEPEERPPHSMRRWRLKRSVDMFEAKDGSLYLLRDGSGDDFVLEQPAAWEREFLRRLAQGFTSQRQLLSHLRARRISDRQIEKAIADLQGAQVLEHSSEVKGLSALERERFDRQLIYFTDLSADGADAEQMQQRLLNAHVVLIGCGGLGCWTAAALVGAGVGALTLVDDDRVALSNLNRQMLFAEADIGQAKVEVAAAALKRQNKRLELRLARRRVRSAEHVSELLDGVDLLIATADWPPHELPRWVNRACLCARVPYITAGQFPPRLRVGPMVIPGQSACLECQERQARLNHPLYDQIAEHRSRRPATAATIGAVSGIVGSMLAMEAIHLLTGATPPATVDKVLIFDARTMTCGVEVIKRDPRCPLCS